MKRRDFIAATAALVGSATWRCQGAAPLIQQPATRGTVVLFQGDSVTDCGRDRSMTDANAAGALGSGYPLLVASAALAARPDGGRKFFNRGVSGNKGPELQERRARYTLGPMPQLLTISTGVSVSCAKLEKGAVGALRVSQMQNAP